jgi:hypothetical protein
LFFNVKIDSTLSGSHDILAGVPLGSDIAPFLYILFTADIPSSENTLADDTAILASDHDPLICSHLLQNHLNKLSKWCNTWKIKVNEFKSIHVTFNSDQRTFLKFLSTTQYSPTQGKLNTLASYSTGDSPGVPISKAKENNLTPAYI